MRKFKKGDLEYKSNGHYLIEGVHYMSIWSFKKLKNIQPNTNDINGNDGIELYNNGISSYESEPDFGNFGTVLLYPLEELEKFYQL